MRKLQACLMVAALVSASCVPMQVAFAAPVNLAEQSSGQTTTPLILALNPQPEPPGFWAPNLRKRIPLSLLPPGLCRTKTYFTTHLVSCEAGLSSKSQGT